MSNYKIQVLVCGGNGCKSSDSEMVAYSLRENIEKNGLNNDVQVVMSGCFGFCGKGPIVNIQPDNTFYVSVKPDDCVEIVTEHLAKGNKIERLIYNELNANIAARTDFNKKQLKIALRNCGFIDPENIDEAIAVDAYLALGKVLSEMTAAQVIDIVKRSGIRGRGGAGFPTGVKWEIASKVKGDVKYVVCNADEGDPGAFMDRSVLEGDPHSVLEAMAICGYCIGASNGLIYIRAEYPLAIERLKIAINQAREYSLLGKNIFGSDFNFDIELKYGAGAFVCGEETALIHSMEGLRGEPTFKPPFPAESGYKGKPTNVNNVETYANIPVIILKGAEWFASIGTEKSKGTKVFALAGKVNNVGLIEVPMGTTLREIIFDIGGGIKDGKKFRSVQIGGPSGGFLTEKHLDVPVDYESLTANGSMMGSGSMIIMSEEDCMVAMAKFYLDFTVEESCGKCTPCRVGNKRLNEMLHKITQGKGTIEDIDLLKNLSYVIKDTSLCQLGGSSPNPVLSTIDVFYDEYMAHIKEHRCPAGQCKALMHYFIDPEHCIGCMACARNCPVNCISGERKQPHTIDQVKCIKCGACLEKCKFNAVIVK